ncbi:MAG: inositol monophosphatase [Candidatus Dojkabacteria bacterium]
MNKEFKKILQTIKQAGRLALDYQSKLKIHKKSDGIDFSTQADSEIEQLLYDSLKQLFPKDGFWGEESEELREESYYIWYVDPIDGTKFFAADIPLWSVSVARVKKGEKVPVFSAIYSPKDGNLFYAMKSEGAWKNDKKLEINNSSEISKLTVAFDFVPTDNKVLNSEIYGKLSKLLQTFYRVRLFGCGSLSTVWTATGFFGCFIKYLQGTKQYNDVVAGLLIAQEAGLNVDYQTLDNGLERIIICHKDVLEKVQNIID